MQQIGSSTYSLLGMDTCVFSEVLRNRNGAREGFLSLFGGGKHVPCFTVYSLYELRRRTEIYEQFVDFFDVFPCAVLKSEEQLFEDETKAYPSPYDIDPTLFGFSVLNTSRGTNLRNLLEVVFDSPEAGGREKEWPSLQRELLTAWLELKPNYHPKGGRFTPTAGLEFVDLVTISQATDRDLDWVGQVIRSGREFDPALFPSLRMTAWTLYFRLYAADRHKPCTNDVFDVLISTSAPYLDAVITENFQADIYQQVSRLDASLRIPAVYTLRDLTQHA